ncbi:nucleoside hydrolase [Microbacterium keratanolyticum]|uniref:nucleoside hydrolase n=1 Tax=Microbacterium keratanolyticum TaxID=67574 RepID=UPI003635CAC8
MPANSIPVILDVDTGIDDALALLLAVRHPALDVRAVTCVGGNVPLAQVVENTLGVLALAGGEDIPVAAGMSAPLIEPARDASYVHGENGVADLRFPAHTMSPVPVHAVELLRRTLMDADEPLTIIALAPLTNIAVLLRMHPEVTNKIERILFMGGAVGAGNATAAAEFNIWHDPEAADIVVRSGVPTTMYGLEPFYRVCCDAETIASFDGATDPVGATAGALLRHLAQVTEDEARIVHPSGAAIGDAGAVCAVIDPAGVTVRRAPVSVALHDVQTRGQTVVDLRSGLGAGGEITKDAQGNIDVVLEVDGDRYARLFLDAVR